MRTRLRLRRLASLLAISAMSLVWSSPAQAAKVNFYQDGSFYGGWIGFEYNTVCHCYYYFDNWVDLNDNVSSAINDSYVNFVRVYQDWYYQGSQLYIVYQSQFMYSVPYGTNDQNSSHCWC